MDAADVPWWPATGTGFGSGDLMHYFGPNVGAGAANKMNATM